MVRNSNNFAGTLLASIRKQHMSDSQQLKMRFKDLAKGARFKYEDGEDVWVVIEPYGYGLIVKWLGVKADRWQSICSFVDDDFSLESEVIVIC